MKKNQSRFLLASILGLTGATCLCHAAFASGFALREGAADWLGNAFAGETAKAYDASTAWSNPAGMTRLDQSELDASVSYIGANSRFSGTNSSPFGGNVAGSTGGNAVQAVASGGMFGVWDLSPRFRLGFGVTAPFGERVSYPGDFVGRYQSLVSSITDIDIGLAAAFKLNDHLSIGGGPNIDYFSARLTQAINTAPLGDSLADVHGNDVGVGFNFGVLYQFTPETRLGVDYRSRITHDINGTETLSGPITGLLPSSTGANTSITLPDSMSVGLYHQINDKLAIMSDIQWTHWSLLNTLNITPTNPAVPATDISEKWHNTWYGGLGLNYQILPKLMLQTGAAYDESPVTDGNRTTRVPDASHYILGVGAQYKVLPNATLQLAYAHIFTRGGNINNTAAAALGSGTIIGSYDDSDNSVTAGVTVKF
jgi:long-chain fatty acid transport protein